MGRNPKIKLNIKTEKQLNELVECSICNNKIRYREAYFRVDESNIAITNNAKPVCEKCKQNKEIVEFKKILKLYEDGNDNKNAKRNISVMSIKTK